MDEEDLSRAVHDAEVTVWVGKSGVGAVVDEFRDQINDREVVKVKFLPSARSRGSTTALAEELAEETGVVLYDVRGHTAMYHR